MYQFVRASMKKLWRLFDAFNEDELYRNINLKDVVTAFHKHNTDDIQEFCASYTYARHERSGQLNNQESKKKMYDTLEKFLIHREMNKGKERSINL